MENTHKTWTVNYEKHDTVNPILKEENAFNIIASVAEDSHRSTVEIIINQLVKNT